jgi:predicted anti-sigma-YlaC factor YlaD
VTTFDAHLAECEECRAYLESYRRVCRVAAATRENADAAGEMPPRLVAAILAARGDRGAG